MTPTHKQGALPFSDTPVVRENEQPRSITLNDRIVPYVLRRTRRRSIGLQIDHRGLRVNTPIRTSIAEIESMIRKHADWVTDKLEEWKSRRRPEKTSVRDGSQIPYLGRMLSIRLAIGQAPMLSNEQATETLTLFIRTPEKAGLILEEVLRDKALAYFSERLIHFASLMELSLPKLTLSAAKTRWGSCSKLSGIRLNWRLIHFPPAVIDYVVVHELAHLIQMNHSAAFWEVVERYCPDYRHHRRQLKTLAAQCPSW